MLDRLVGYKASPVLWKTVKKGLSAGRVQTVALRLLVEREREIRAFKPTEYWTIAAAAGARAARRSRRSSTTSTATSRCIPNEASAQAIVSDVSGRKTFDVTDIKRRERRKNPAAPFTTSTLQQEAAKKLGFGSKRTMRLAQNLYEGIELGKVEGPVGLITYMRTDSTRIAESAVAQARDYLRSQFAEAYLAKTPSSTERRATATHRTRTRASVPRTRTRTPEAVQRYLTPEQFKLYQLIWQRFMASQMAPAVFDTTTVDFDIRTALHQYLFRATGSVMKFKGFLSLYKEAREEGEGKALEDEQALPADRAGRAGARARGQAHAALHRAAAAILGGEPREGARTPRASGGRPHTRPSSRRSPSATTPSSSSAASSRPRWARAWRR